ncbi:hypothetical protein QYE76_002455 [Lolium multiflorum]|uniref:Uncharacterized protein n=1 Tax=Lolium multiflorum TaxID=4521 RepID=A0AAD8VXX5_LOLMU|nr:hypothetical protein QYE76_002455 [Lolium multiflorum]
MTKEDSVDGGRNHTILAPQIAAPFLAPPAEADDGSRQAQDPTVAAMIHFWRSWRRSHRRSSRVAALDAEREDNDIAWNGEEKIWGAARRRFGSGERLGRTASWARGSGGRKNADADGHAAMHEMRPCGGALGTSRRGGVRLTLRARVSSPRFSLCSACPERPLWGGDGLGAPNTVSDNAGQKTGLEDAAEKRFGERFRETRLKML